MYKTQDHQITTETSFLNPCPIIRMEWIIYHLLFSFNLVTPMYIQRHTLSTTGTTSLVTKIISSENLSFLSIQLLVSLWGEIKYTYMILKIQGYAHSSCIPHWLIATLCNSICRYRRWGIRLQIIRREPFHFNRQFVCHSTETESRTPSQKG